MSELQVTDTFVKKLAKNIRNKYGLEPRHTEVLELIADALGWQPGPLMHALKQDSRGTRSPGSALTASTSREFLPYSLETVDPLVQSIRGARSMHKLGSISSDDVACLMEIVAKPGLLLIVGEKVSEANEYAMSVAKDWEVRIGHPIEYDPYLSKHEVIPFSEGLGIVRSSLSHLAVIKTHAGNEGRFALIGVAGSPLNIERALESSKIQATVATISRASLCLLAGLGASAQTYWSGKQAKSDQQECLAALTSIPTTILDVEVIGGRFHRAKLQNWDSWLLAQSE
jgi:hypothetical protein